MTWLPNNFSGSAVTVAVSYSFDLLLIGFLPMDPIRLEGPATLAVV